MTEPDPRQDPEYGISNNELPETLRQPVMPDQQYKPQPSPGDPDWGPDDVYEEAILRGIRRGAAEYKAKLAAERRNPE
jgi:hypothetical protein